jgi:hypothetical protein
MPFPAPSSEVPAAPPASVDVVYLNDGTSLSGFIVKREPGKFVTIRTTDGGEQTLDWSIVQRISIAPRAGQAEAPSIPPPALVPPPAAPASSAPVASPPAATVPVAAPSIGEPPLSESAPPSEFARRPHSFVKVGLEVFETYQRFGPFSSLGLGLELATRGLIGLGNFPGGAGGGWSSLAISAFVRGWGAFGWDDSDSLAELASVSGGGTLGYSYMHFGGLNDENKQAGIGFMASFRLGYQGLWELPPNTGSGASLCYGPSIALTFPRYSARDGGLNFNAVDFAVTVADPGHVGLTQYQLGWVRTF